MRGPNIPPDATLRRLGTELAEQGARERQAWQAMRPNADEASPEHAAAEALSVLAGTTVDKMVATPAATIEGVMVKIRGYLWCIGNEIPDDDLLNREAYPTNEARIVASLLRDLAAMALKCDAQTE